LQQLIPQSGALLEYQELNGSSFTYATKHPIVQEKRTFQQKAKGYTFVCSIFLFLAGNT
jgi:glutathionylspermidine synthase